MTGAYYYDIVFWKHICEIGFAKKLTRFRQTVDVCPVGRTANGSSWQNYHELNEKEGNIFRSKTFHGERFLKQNIYREVCFTWNDQKPSYRASHLSSI
jgi:hypothetical protein